MFNEGYGIKHLVFSNKGEDEDGVGVGRSGHELLIAGDGHWLCEEGSLFLQL